MNEFIQRVGVEITNDEALKNCVRNTPDNTDVEFASAVRRAANKVFGEVTVLWKKIDDRDPEILRQLREFLPSTRQTVSTVPASDVKS